MGLNMYVVELKYFSWWLVPKSIEVISGSVGE